MQTPPNRAASVTRTLNINLLSSKCYSHVVLAITVLCQILKSELNWINSFPAKKDNGYKTFNFHKFLNKY